MPGNIVQINNSEELEWYVGDSRMEELIKWLGDNGYKQPTPSKNKIESIKDLINKTK